MTEGKNSKKVIIIAVIVLIIVGCALGYWKRIGIRNRFMRIAGIEIPRNIKNVYGNYGQAVKVSYDLGNTIHIMENDAASERTDSNIPLNSSAVVATRQIDAGLKEELEAGQYTFDDPMVIQDPFQNSPLTAIALFQTEEACPVRCTVKGRTEAADLTYDTPAQTKHEVPLIGLYPAADNTVVLQLLDDSGNAVSEKQLTVSTSGLPENMEGVVEPVVCSGASAYDLTMVCGQQTLHPFAYDCNGDVRWYLSQQGGFYGCFTLSNGHFLFQDDSSYSPSKNKPQTTNACEMDYLGRTYKVYYFPFGFHHEIREKEPGGNLLCLTSSMKDHYEDVIVELDRETGETVNSLNLIELFPNTYTGRMDWCHMNTISYQADQDTILISARNLHSVIKIGWTDHKLKWILCDPAFWKGTKYEKYVLTPTQDNILWHYQQHTSYQIDDDLDGDPNTVEISLFDNHTDQQRKIDTFKDTGFSYVTVYAVNEQEGSVSLLRQYEVLRSKVCSLTQYDSASGHIFGMSGIIGKNAWHGYRGMNYEFDYESGEILNQFAIKTTFYQSKQMDLNVSSMCAEEEDAENYLLGSLHQPMETKQKVPEPEGSLEEGVSLSRIGTVLYVKAPNHKVSQVIFQGESNTYVYDITPVIMEVDEYLNFVINMPVAMSGMAPDTYKVLCVYDDALYRITQSGKEAYVTIK